MPPRQGSVPFNEEFARVSCLDMKKVKHMSGKALSGRSRRRFFRRFIRKLFSGVMKRQEYYRKEEAKEVLRRLREVEESVEIIAREMARQAKRSSRG